MSPTNKRGVDKREFLCALMYIGLILLTVILTHFLSMQLAPGNRRDGVQQRPHATEPSAFTSLGVSTSSSAPAIAMFAVKTEAS